MRITCVDEEVAGALQRGYFTIPRFQRPYSWDRENVDDFLDDVITRGADSYFIGSMVVYEDGSNRFAVVDGQQRLTTITLLLCALRDVFDELDDHSSAEGLQGLVERRDLRNKAQYVLQTQSSYPYLQDVIQRHGDPQAEHEIGPEEERLADAFNRIVAFVRSGVSGVLADQTLDEKTRRKRAISRLEQMRDQVLGLKLILVDVDNQDDAYVIFETLNTRGKDLGVSDLVRNHLLWLLKKDNENLDLARDTFDGVLTLFRASRADINANKFILHQWLSEYSYVSEAKLFRAIRSTIGEAQAEQYLDRLRADARLYRAISEPLSPLRTWKREEMPARSSLEALAIFGVTQPLPMLLSLMRAYEAGGIKLPKLKAALAAIERFHFAFTAVASQPSSGGISSMYALHARELTAASDQQAKADVIAELSAKLREKRPPREIFVAGFMELRASELYSQQKALVTYILRRFHAEHVGGPLPAFDAMGIEHLAPQGDAGDPDLVAMVGNLLYVDDGLNEGLGSKSFAAKQTILKSATGVWVDDLVLEATTWRPAQIEARTRALAGEAYDRLWAF